MQNHQNKELIYCLDILQQLLENFFKKQSKEDHTKILKWFKTISKLRNDKFKWYKDHILNILVNELSSFNNNFEELKDRYNKSEVSKYQKESNKFDSDFQKSFKKGQEAAEWLIKNQDLYLWVTWKWNWIKYTITNR